MTVASAIVQMMANVGATVLGATAFLCAFGCIGAAVV